MLDLLPAEQEAVPAARQAEAARPPADLQLAAAKAELAELRRQVAGKDEEIATLQRSLQQQTQAAATRDALRAEALEAELKATQVDRSRLQEQLQSQQRDPGDGGERAAAARIQELEAQVSELTGVVQEFLEQQAGGNDDSDSLRAELETVRTQASADVMSLQTKLRAEEQEVSRLRRDLDGTYAQVLQLQTGLHGGSGRRKSPWRTQAVSIVIGFALLLCGMLLTLFLLRVADLGHSLGVMDAGSEPVRPLAPPPLPALPQLPAPPPA
jgi:chromosome segregation ATPase